MFRIGRSSVDFKQGDVRAIANYVPPRKPEPETPEPVAAPAPPPVPSIDMEAVRREANAIVDAATKQAGALMEQARSDADSVLKSAHESGYQKGLKDGETDIKRQLLAEREREAEAFLSAMSKLSSAADGLFLEMEKNILALALAIGEKVVGKSLEDNEGLFEQVVHNALKAIKAEGKIVVNVGTDDFARYFPTGKTLFKVGEDAVPIQVVEDTSLAPGSIMVDTPKETVDASVKTQVTLIREAFAKGKPR